MGAKRCLAAVAALGLGLWCFAYSEAQALAYIEKHKDTALKFEKEYGIPAPITLAQALLESGAGTSGLTKASNNHFCIKADSSWPGRIFLCWDDEKVKSKFRCYDSSEESFLDYAKLLSSVPRYRSLFSINIYDYRRWAQGLKKAGYATSPIYAQSLIGLIEVYKLYNINGGVKLKAGKTQYITRYKVVERTSERVSSDSIVDNLLTEEGMEVSLEIADDEITEEEEAMAESLSKYSIVEINDIHCTVLQPGESLRSIARKYNISQDKLLTYNELATPDQVGTGDIVFLDKKKKKYHGSQDMYIVKDCESLYEISQSFGIQLQHLAKMNNMSAYSVLEKGMKIYLK